MPLAQAWTGATAEQKADAEMTQNGRSGQGRPGSEGRGTWAVAEGRAPALRSPPSVGLPSCLPFNLQGSGPAGMKSHPNLWWESWAGPSEHCLLLKSQGSIRLGRTWGPGALPHNPPGHCSWRGTFGKGSSAPWWWASLVKTWSITIFLLKLIYNRKQSAS